MEKTFSIAMNYSKCLNLSMFSDKNYSVIYILCFQLTIIGLIT